MCVLKLFKCDHKGLFTHTQTHTSNTEHTECVQSVIPSSQFNWKPPQLLRESVAKPPTEAGWEKHVCKEKKRDEKWRTERGKRQKKIRTNKERAKRRAEAGELRRRQRWMEPRVQAEFSLINKWSQLAEAPLQYVNTAYKQLSPRLSPRSRKKNMLTEWKSADVLGFLEW